ncbi:MAG: cupin domain-containing protein [Dehalococcoidia bacterium]
MANPRWRPLANTNPTAPFPGVNRRTLVSGDNLTFLRVELDAGASVPEHTHPHEQAGTVASGSVTLRIGDEEHEVTAGGSYLIPGDLPHVVTAIEPTVILECFSPVREEFAND